MKKKILAMLLAAVMVAAMLPTAFAADSPTSGTCGDGVTWSYSDGTLTIQGTGAMNDYGMDDHPWYNYLGEIQTVVIENGVTSIGNFAFFSCSNLTTVTIPNSVTSIGNITFVNCGSLTNVTIPDSVTSIGNQAFNSCGSLTSVTLPTHITAIPSGLFAYCSDLTSVTIPDSVTTIEYGAFDGCGNLTNVYYGGSKSQWEQITVDEANDPLLNAEIHYAVTESEPGPGTTEPGPGTTEPKTSFSDVTEGIWYEKAVSWAADKGYIKGSGGKFFPDNNMQRNAIFTILGRIAGADVDGGSPWYQKAVDWAKANNVSSGEDPEGEVTLEQMIVMLYRYEDRPEADTSVLDRFSDSADIHTWKDFREAMAWAVESGLIQGSGGKLMPLDTLQRSRGAMVLQRYCQNILGEE